MRHPETLPLLCVLLPLMGAGATEARAQQDPLVMRIAPVAPRFHVISGYANGNILVFEGQAGLLLVDGQSGRRVALADSALRTVTALPVTLLINTHYHDDHIEGNPWWRARGATIMAQAALPELARRDTTIAELDWHQTSADELALPDRTFGDSLALDFEGEPVVLLHPPAAHTRTDAIVWFPRANIVHTGDILEREAPPFLDWWAGGTLDGMIAAVDRMLAMVNDHTVIVPGHGTPTNRAGLSAYRAMLVAARERIGARVVAGESAEAIAAERPLAEFEAERGGARPMAQFVRIVANGLARAAAVHP